MSKAANKNATTVKTSQQNKQQQQTTSVKPIKAATAKPSTAKKRGSQSGQTTSIPTSTRSSSSQSETNNKISSTTEEKTITTSQPPIATSFQLGDNKQTSAKKVEQKIPILESETNELPEYTTESAVKEKETSAKITREKATTELANKETPKTTTSVPFSVLQTMAATILGAKNESFREQKNATKAATEVIMISGGDTRASQKGSTIHRLEVDEDDIHIHQPDISRSTSTKAANVTPHSLKTHSTITPLPPSISAGTYESGRERLESPLGHTAQNPSVESRILQTRRTEAEAVSNGPTPTGSSSESMANIENPKILPTLANATSRESTTKNVPVDHFENNASNKSVPREPPQTISVVEQHPKKQSAMSSPSFSDSIEDEDDEEEAIFADSETAANKRTTRSPAEGTPSADPQPSFPWYYVAFGGFVISVLFFAIVYGCFRGVRALCPSRLSQAAQSQSSDENGGIEVHLPLVNGTVHGSEKPQQKKPKKPTTKKESSKTRSLLIAKQNGTTKESLLSHSTTMTTALTMDSIGEEDGAGIELSVVDPLLNKQWTGRMSSGKVN